MPPKTSGGNAGRGNIATRAASASRGRPATRSTSSTATRSASASATSTRGRGASSSVLPSAGRGRSSSTSTVPSNEDLQRQIAQLQAAINARQEPENQQAVLPENQQRGRKRKSTAPVVEESEPNIEVTVHDDLDLSDSNEQNVNEIVTDKGHKNKRSRVSDNDNSLQQQVSELRSMVESHFNNRNPDIVNNKQASSTTGQNSLQEQINVLRDLVSSLVDNDTSFSRDAVSDMQVDDQSVSKALNEAIAEPDTVEGDSECYTNFMVAGFNVDIRTKSNIWSYKYVDLATLRPKSEMKTNSNSGSTSSNNLKPPVNWQDWYRLFTVYAAVYIEKYPAEAVGLLTYMLKIHNFARKDSTNYNWREYDVRFRQLRSFATTLPWHVTNNHVLLDVQTDNTINSKQPFRKPNVNAKNATNERSGKAPVCYDFNDRTKFCNRQSCKFPHKCSKCLGNHPQYACNKGSNTAASTSTTVSNKGKK